MQVLGEYHAQQGHVSTKQTAKPFFHVRVSNRDTCIIPRVPREFLFQKPDAICRYTFAVKHFLKINIYKRRPRSGGYIYGPKKDQRTEKLFPLLDNEAFEHGETFRAGVIKIQTQTCMACLGIREIANGHIK